ncbi:hypothetical protein ACS0TY_000358 [Phlomoides rotata]
MYQIYSSSSNRKCLAWHKPPVGFIKLNVGSAFFTNTHEMGFGFVMHNSYGTHIFSKSLNMLGLYSLDEGEAIGLFEALGWIKELDLRNVIIEMDAKLVVDAFNARRLDTSSVFGDIIDACKRSFRTHPFCRVAWVGHGVKQGFSIVMKTFSFNVSGLGGDLDKHDKELHSNGARASPTSVYPTLLVVIVGGEDDNINRCFPNSSIVIVEDEEDSIHVCCVFSLFSHYLINGHYGQGGRSVAACVFLLDWYGLEGGGIASGGSCELIPYTILREQKFLLGWMESLLSYYICGEPALEGDGVASGGLPELIPGARQLLLGWMQLYGDILTCIVCLHVALCMHIVTAVREMADEVTLSGKTAHRKFPLKVAKLIE